MSNVIHTSYATLNDLQETIVCAVKDTHDNDTIAAIVGALCGRAALPRRWIDGLLGRTRDDDDGRVLKLIVRSRLRGRRARPTFEFRPRGTSRVSTTSRLRAHA